MNKVDMLTVAMELIEDKIADCMRRMDAEDNIEIENEYKELQEIRKRIYNRDFDVIEKIIKEVRMKEND